MTSNTASKLLLSCCLSLACSTISHADNDPVKSAINTKFANMGSIGYQSQTGASPITYYFQMKGLNFPGSQYPVIFPIVCTQTTTPLT